MLEALVDRQDHQLARTAEPAVHQDPGEIRLGARIVALVVRKDLLDALADLHLMGSGGNGKSLDIPRRPPLGNDAAISADQRRTLFGFALAFAAEALVAFFCACFCLASVECIEA